MCYGSLLIKQNAESKDIYNTVKTQYRKWEFQKILGYAIQSRISVRKMTGYNADDEGSTVSQDGSRHHCIQ